MRTVVDGGLVRATAWTLGHRPSLDALRGIAILLVFAGHFGFPILPAGGSIGVSLFFALSGYLITGLLLGELAETGRVDLRAFYVRRARRLLPGLAVLLAWIGAWAALTGHLTTWLPDAASVALYVGNWWWLAGHPLTGIAHAWSLAVEEQFYILWPALLLFLGRRAIPAALVLVAVSFAITTILLPDQHRSLYGSDVRVKDLLLGALVAMVSMRLGRDLVIPTSAAILSAGLLVFVGTNAMPEAGPLLTAVPCALLVAWFAARPAIAAWRPMTFTGRISYGLYLFHFPLEAGPFAIFNGLSLWPRMAALLASSYVIATASWFAWERRWLRRKGHQALGALDGGEAGRHGDDQAGRRRAPDPMVGG